MKVIYRDNTKTFLNVTFEMIPDSVDKMLAGMHFTHSSLCNGRVCAHHILQTSSKIVSSPQVHPKSQVLHVSQVKAAASVPGHLVSSFHLKALHRITQIYSLLVFFTSLSRLTDCMTGPTGHMRSLQQHPGHVWVRNTKGTQR